MAKVLQSLRNSPAACSFCIACGVGIMLSIAYLEPGDALGMGIRHALGGTFLLMPAWAHRNVEER